MARPPARTTAAVGLAALLLVPLVAGSARAAEVLDAPLVTVAPDSPGTSAAPTFTVTAADPTVCAFGLQGALPAPVPCTSPYVGAADSDGTWVLAVRAVSGADTSPLVTTSYVRDTTAPDPPAVTGMPASGSSTAASWDFALAAGDTAVCELQQDGAVRTTRTACTSPAAFTLTGSGTWSLRVTVTDAAGNEGAPGTSAGYLLDADAPAAPAFTAGPASPGNDLTPTWDLDRSALQADEQVQCRLLRGAAVLLDWTAATGGGATATCALPVPGGTGDGPLAVQARSTDPVGNTSETATGPAYLLDTTGPATTVSGPSGPGNDPTPTWSFVPESGAGASCRLDEVGGPTGTPVDCTAGQLTPAALPDGSYRLTVQQTDAVGNAGPAATVDYQLDTVAPVAPVVSGPSGTGAVRAVSWTWPQAPDESARCRAVIDGAAQADVPCGAPGRHDATLPADASWQLQVLLTDAAGNTGTWAADAGTSPAYLLDTAAPGPPVVVGPGPVTSSRSPVWTVTPAPDAAATTCRVARPDGSWLAAAAPCSGAFGADLTGQPDGGYRLTATSTDAAGNTATATDDTVLDTTAPAPPGVSGPSGPGHLTGSTWNLTGEPGAAFSCRLVHDGVPGTWAPCADPYVVTLPADGSWVLEVTQTDAAGLTSVPAAGAPYLLDRRVPALTVTAPAPTSGATPTWTIGTDGDPTTLTCVLVRPDTGPLPVSCSSGSYALPLAVPAVQGHYVLQVSVLSAAGVPAGADSGYDLDTVAPTVTVDVGPTPTDDATPLWSTTASPDATTALDCRLVGPLPAVTTRACTWVAGQVREANGSALDFGASPDGRYVLLLRVADAAGNASAVPAVVVPTAAWVLDRVAAPVGTTLPPVGSSPAPRWAFTGVEPGATVSCTLTGPGGAPQPVGCDPTGFTGALTQDGLHVLSVQQTDLAGNTSAVAELPYTLDTAAPVVQGLAVVGPALAPARSTAFAFGSDDASATFTCTLRSRLALQVGPCTSPYAVGAGTLTADDAYALTVVATDPAGNASVAATATYTLDTTAPDAPVFTAYPAAIDRDPQPQWALSASEAGLTTTCRLESPTSGTVLVPARSCVPEGFAVDLVALGLPEGDYVVRAVSTDGAGNSSPDRLSPVYRFDLGAQAGFTWLDFPSSAHAAYDPATLPPVAQPGFTADPDLAYLFRTAAGASVTCTLYRLGPDDARVAVVPTPPCTKANQRWSLAHTLTAPGTYLLEVTSALAPFPLYTTSKRVVYDPAIGPPVFITGNSAGGTPSYQWQWAPPDSDPHAVATCDLRLNGSRVSYGFCPAGGSLVQALPTPGRWSLTVTYVDEAGNASAGTRTYAFDRLALPAPVIELAPATRGLVGVYDDLVWTFRVPPGVTATCVLKKDDRVVAGSSRSCTGGSYRMPLDGATPGTFTLTVTFSQVNRRGSFDERSFLLLARVTPVGPPPTAEPGPTGGPGPSTPPVGPGGPGHPGDGLDGQVVVPDLPDGPVDGPQPPPVGRGPGDLPEASGPLDIQGLPGRLGDTLIPALRDVVGKPALPLALLALVVAFLVVQNRIDSRDPKLAAAPVEAEPELGFDPVLRRSPGTPGPHGTAPA